MEAIRRALNPEMHPITYDDSDTTSNDTQHSRDNINKTTQQTELDTETMSKQKACDTVESTDSGNETDSDGDEIVKKAA